MLKSIKKAIELSFLIFLPQIILHELSHYIFIKIARMKQYFEFKYSIKEAGFYPSETIKAGIRAEKWQVVTLIIGCLSPALTGIIYFIAVNQLEPSNLRTYLFFGMVALIPSSPDITMARSLIKHLNKAK